jgi:hypothetical protein
MPGRTAYATTGLDAVHTAPGPAPARALRTAPVPQADGWAARTAWLAILGAILCSVVSKNLLVTAGIPYNIPGGNPVWKFHPGTYVVALAVVMAALAANPFRFVARAVRIALPCVAFTGVLTVIMAYTVIRFGIAGAAFMVDSLLVPALVAMVLALAPPGVAERGCRVAVAVLAVNAVIGIGEAAVGERLVPYMVGDQPVAEHHFRATALLGHPLNNAAATSLAIFATLALPWKPWVKAAFCALFAMGLMAFGSRTAMAATLLLSGMLAAHWGSRLMLRRLLRPQHVVAATGLILMLPLLAAIAYGWLGLGQRIAEAMYWDASANTRLEAFKIFNYIAWENLVFGTSSERLEQVIDQLVQYTSLSTVENVWLILMVQFGLYLFAIFIISFAWFLVWLGRWLSAPGRFMLICFLLAASSNNSLASKTGALSLLVVLAMGLADRPRRR